MEEIKYFVEDEFDIIVVGAGHAGCEAGLASSRLGKKTLVITMSLESIGDLPCNPNIGGTGKGHLVREIDALGGQMAINIDKSFIQSRMLNTSKGPAVHSLRVQADKIKYHINLKKVLEDEKNLSLVEGEVIEILEEDGRAVGVKLSRGSIFKSKAVIVASGTYLSAEILMGELKYKSGPHGMAPSYSLSDSLRKLGISLKRFKTGTPARVHKDSLDYSLMEVQKGDEKIIPFSFMTDRESIQIDQVDCYLTYTTEETKKIILENLHRSPMYSGEKRGVGPRYCPSIEDKVVRFSDKDVHQVFIEPEGLTTKEMYAAGVSSTLPYEVQLKMYKTIKGMKDVKILRPCYGIEYDTIEPTRLKRTLESKDLESLYFAGQINGSSGYEEAACQGLVAGINASRKIDGLEDFILDRSNAYIGVLIDDLVTKGTNEPYRMMTSRCEYRLYLRQDNADIRLTQKGYDIGLVSEERYRKFKEKKELIDSEIERLKLININPSLENNKILLSLGSEEIKNSISLYNLIKRPELNLLDTLKAFETYINIPIEVLEEVEIISKYEGYIKKQMQQIESFRKLENRSLKNIEDYKDIKGLSNEAIQKLNQMKPDSVGQASRISGVSPSDINVLLIHLELERRKVGK
ncbi:tRNA uridine-5-carboxymethylaminomethyl(34) synthesis enzyme MnmG [Citroniella saccharovorans]|uniref:tRNA uridine-5-carboxymethylaminomethyl(34) synthesis enzyme MnmG n=1 Tax=Citroniella saccharovorans TaxID=2053367 RepID=UPI0036167F10